MRHAAVTFAEQVRSLVDEGHAWDVFFCTDMLNLAEFIGLVPETIARLPRVVFFHENQLTYPSRLPECQEDRLQRDEHFAFTNFTSALAATEIWFNSSFHCEEFLNALPVWLKRFPDHQPIDSAGVIAEKARVLPPGIDVGVSSIRAEHDGPLRILWNARWEHDKNPDLFFAALYELKNRSCDFRLNMLGESFTKSPTCFSEARDRLSTQIEHWGFVESRDAYLQILRQSDVVVSTATHEFFGLAVLEAVACGCLPVLPSRLSYPEIFAGHPELFYNTVKPSDESLEYLLLADHLETLIHRPSFEELRNANSSELVAIGNRYSIDRTSTSLDEVLNEIQARE